MQSGPSTVYQPPVPDSFKFISGDDEEKKKKEVKRPVHKEKVTESLVLTSR